MSTVVTMVQPSQNGFAVAVFVDREQRKVIGHKITQQKHPRRWWEARGFLWKRPAHYWN